MIIHASVFKGFIATPDTYWGGNLAIFVCGLVGWNKGLIVDGHADVSITGGVPASETGGLAGMVSGKVISSNATGSIDLAGFAGGLVGLIDSGSIISRTRRSRSKYNTTVQAVWQQARRGEA